MRAMNAGMKNGINLLMILVLFISCVQEKEDNNVLRRVEACMELFPDSALSLLSQMMSRMYERTTESRLCFAFNAGFG